MRSSPILLAAPASERLLPESAFQLYAVATRTPRKLLAAQPSSTVSSTVQPTTRPGVYDLQWGARTIRLIVEERLRGLPPEERLRGLNLEELDANERATLQALLKKLN